MKTTTPKAWLSTLEAIQKTLAALVAQVELPTIEWDAEPERQVRPQQQKEYGHRAPSRSF